MTQEQAEQLLTMVAIIQSGVITLLVIKIAKYTVKIINYIRKKIKEN